MSAQRILVLILLASASHLAAQTPPEPATPHDITMVDTVPLDGAIAVPLLEKQRKKMRKYDLPELAGARQALGSQLIDGDLPKPLLDYRVRSASLDQRISFFEGGLVVMNLTGAGWTIRKRVIIPDDALAAYRKSASPATIAAVHANELAPPADGRVSQLRAYRDDGSFAELAFDPTGTLPKALGDQIHPLEDLIRALSEDREVTSTVAGYEPKVGDELVGDDEKTWRVERVIADAGIVELRCMSQPTVIYVDKHYLYNYFIGKRGPRAAD